MRVGAIVVVMLAGCGAEGEPDPVAFSVRVARQEPQNPPRPPPQVAATVYIDGQARELYERTFASNEEFLQTDVIVELRHGDLILDRFTTGGTDCEGHTRVDSVFFDVCRFDHGELALGSVSVDTLEGGCIADGFCIGPTCLEISCQTGEHCTSIMTSLDPPFSRLECAAVGARAAGEACTWAPTADGAHQHDCAADLLCVEGICRSVCTDPSGCFTCVPVEGHSFRLLVCP